MSIPEVLGIVQQSLHAARHVSGELEIDLTFARRKTQQVVYQYGNGQHIDEFIDDLTGRMADQKRVSLEVRCPSANYHAFVDYRQGDEHSVLSARAWGLPLSEIDEQQMRGNSLGKQKK